MGPGSQMHLLCPLEQTLPAGSSAEPGGSLGTSDPPAGCLQGRREERTPGALVHGTACLLTL